MNAPERPDDWVPVRVTSVDEHFVGLDANVALQGALLSVHLHIHELHKLRK